MAKNKPSMQYFIKNVQYSINDVNDKNSASKVRLQVVSSIDNIIDSLTEDIKIHCKALDSINAKSDLPEEFLEIISIFQFFYLSFIDILILHKQYLLTDNLIEKNFICRTAAQHMYELLEDGAKALGKQINITIGQSAHADIQVSLKYAKYLIIKKNLHNTLKEIRHNVSGHKDRNIRNQYKIYNSINLVDFQENFILFSVFIVHLRGLQLHHKMYLKK